MPLTTLSMSWGIFFRLVSLRARTVPSMVTFSAMMLERAPPSIFPMVRTAGSDGVDGPADDGLERRDDLGGQDDGVDALVGPGPVGALPLDRDLERVRAGHDVPGREIDLADVLRPDVKAEDGPDRRVLQDAFLDHQGGAALLVLGRALLGRLEDELDVPLDLVLDVAEDHGRAQGDRGVDVVAAGVHHPGVEGLEGDVRRFLDGQGVHVGPDGHGRPGLAAAEEGDDAGPGDARLDLEAQGVELGGDELGGFVFPVAELGIHVDETADLDDLGLDLLDLLVDLQGRLRVHGQEPERRRGRRARIKRATKDPISHDFIILQRFPGNSSEVR